MTRPCLMHHTCDIRSWSLDGLPTAVTLQLLLKGGNGAFIMDLLFPDDERQLSDERQAHSNAHCSLPVTTTNTQAFLGLRSTKLFTTRCTCHCACSPFAVVGFQVDVYCTSDHARS